MTNTIEESFSNIRTVKAFASELDEIAKFSGGNTTTHDIGVEKAKWGAFITFIVSLMGFTAIALLIYSASHLNKA